MWQAAWHHSPTLGELVISGRCSESQQSVPCKNGTKGFKVIPARKI